MGLVYRGYEDGFHILDSHPPTTLANYFWWPPGTSLAEILRKEKIKVIKSLEHFFEDGRGEYHWITYPDEDPSRPNGRMYRPSFYFKEKDDALQFKLSIGG